MIQRDFTVSVRLLHLKIIDFPKTININMNMRDCFFVCSSFFMDVLVFIYIQTSVHIHKQFFI